SASILGRVDPMLVKHEVVDPKQTDRTHPVFYSLAEQWEGWCQAIQDLGQREAFLKRPNGRVAKIRTISVPDPKVDEDELRRVEQHYLSSCFTAKDEIEQRMKRGTDERNSPNVAP